MYVISVFFFTVVAVVWFYNTFIKALAPSRFDDASTIGGKLFAIAAIAAWIAGLVYVIRH